jgi:hypothetical protein
MGQIVPHYVSAASQLAARLADAQAELVAVVGLYMFNPVDPYARIRLVSTLEPIK